MAGETRPASAAASQPELAAGRFSGLGGFTGSDYTPPAFPSLLCSSMRQSDRNMAVLPQLNLRRISSFFVTCLLLGSCLMTSGCVRRRMTIRSNPSGALVFVDDQRIGVTPVSTTFTYYGTRKIQLFKDGLEPQLVKQRFTAPWYQLPVLDFISENLWPFEIRDERFVEVQMTPLQVVPNEQLIGRAEALRNNSRLGLLTPMPNAPLSNAPADGSASFAQPLPYLGNGSRSR